MCKEKEEAVYLEQKQSRNTHPERKSVGVLTNEKDSTSEARQRYTPGKECRHSE